MDTAPEIALLERCYRAADDQREKDIQTMNPLTGAVLSRPWYYYDRIVRGFGYDLIPEMASWASRPNKNVPWVAVQTYTTMLTDAAPSFTVMARGKDDEGLARTVSAAVEHWWELEYMPSKTALAVLTSRTFGIAWLHVYTDDDRNVHCRFVHPESVLVDPDCTVDEYDPAYLIYEYRAQWGELKKRYPGTDWGNFEPDYRIGVMGSTRVQYDRYEQNYNPAKSVMVYQLWYKDPERIVWDDEEDLPGYVVKKSKKKYPNGRVITIAGGVVLADVENDDPMGQIPFTPIHAYPVPGKFYGMGDVQQIMSSYIIRNRFSQHIVDQTFKAGGGIVWLGQQSGVDPNKLTNAPLQIVPCRDPNAVRMDTFPQPSRHIIEYMKGVLDPDMDDLLGLHDITLGRQREGNPITANEAGLIAESDRTRARMASRWLNWALERVGRQVIARWAKYGGFTWMLTLTDEEGPLRVEFDPKHLKGTKLWENLKVGDSSTLPASKQAAVQQVQMLLQMGVITPEDVLKYKLVDIPHAEEILADRKSAAAAAPPLEMGGIGGVGVPGAEMGAQMPADALTGAPMPPEQGFLPPMEAPEGVDAGMMGAMSPIPEDMDMTQLMQAVEQIAQANNLPPEEVFATLMGGIGGEEE